ncbi:MBL fold metallo-hydrolase [Nonomuraea sp. NPDC048916]|uniref:MBL fold metallo-hydrolase n=1 Tax=Nonomuraea sp. NPDC048916 TaxID=3154232 RepID=UPI0033C5CD6E
MRRAERIDDTDRHAWEEPGVYQIAPGVHRVPLPIPEDGLRAVNVYVLEGEDGLTLIDAGWAMPESRALLGDALASLSRTVDDIGDVLVTHVHVDHYSQGVTLRGESGCLLHLGEGERPSLETLHAAEEMEGETQLAQLRLHGAEVVVAALDAAGYGRDRDSAKWEPPDEWIPGGRLFEVGRTRLRALHTPGHTRGHVVFDDPGRGMLFTGDHVLPQITPSIGYESRPGALPLHDFMCSLRAVLDLPDRLMLPAHGPVRSSTHARVAELLAHHEQRLDACAALLGGRPRTAFEIAGGLGWTRRERPFRDLDPVNQMLAVCETAAHLDVLAAGGRCGREESGGVVRYHDHRPQEAR